MSSDEVHLTPDSSPELTKRSWFGNLMTTEKDETFTVLVKGKPLATVKAHLIHAFLSVCTFHFDLIQITTNILSRANTTIFRKIQYSCDFHMLFNQLHCRWLNFHTALYRQCLSELSTKEMERARQCFSVMSDFKYVSYLYLSHNGY